MILTAGPSCRVPTFSTGTSLSNSSMATSVRVLLASVASCRCIRDSHGGIAGTLHPAGHPGKGVASDLCR